ncbi:hypothetical protein BOX15_Mlig008887g2 [Macrostomum lignano]|uniref:EF-hand domain-containing protein n=1 Tax=Macrostomum lignano TaxID=282301 RepID=A0A267G8Q9_9PLAT|nr:hypothetical protein BOX15_Mlig008887g2 [Macrostomum lignano]
METVTEEEPEELLQSPSPGRGAGSEAANTAEDEEEAVSRKSLSSRSRGSKLDESGPPPTAGDSAANAATAEAAEGVNGAAASALNSTPLAAAPQPGNDEDGPRLFRSGKGPAEQAYELFQRELAQWKEEQKEMKANQKQKKRDQRSRAKRLASLDLDSSGSDTDLEDVDDPSRESWTGLTRGLEKLYDRACATYQVTALTQFKFQLTTKHLSITNMSLRHRDVAAMCIPLEHKDDVTHINLSGNLIGTGGLGCLLRVAKEFRSLVNLDLSRNSLGCEAAQLLASSVDNLRSLRSLNVSANSFLERDAECIATLITQLESLRTLNASGNTFGSHGGELIGAALRGNGSLENLSLAHCEIRMRGAEAIGMALKENGSLDYLDVSYNGFSDLGAKALAEGLRVNSALTVLNLTANRVFIDGARAIGGMLAVNETLKELYLDKNSFTCDGAQEILAKLKENENTALKVLDMKNVSVTYKTAAAVLPTVQQPLLIRFESFVREPGSLREQLGIPNGSGSSVPLTQKLQAEAAHVLRVFTQSHRLNLVRLARDAGVRGAGDGLTEAEMRRLLLSLPVGLLDQEVDSLVDSLRGEPGPDGNCTYSLSSLLTLGEPQQQARLETQH